MSQAQHLHAAFDRFPKLVRDLTTEFGSDGIDAVVAKFITAEEADFLWESRFAEKNLGEFASFDGDDEGCQRVAVIGYFGGQYYVAICVVDEERRAVALLKSRQLANFESAETAFLATS